VRELPSFDWGLGTFRRNRPGGLSRGRAQSEQIGGGCWHQPPSTPTRFNCMPIIRLVVPGRKRVVVGATSESTSALGSCLSANELKANAPPSLSSLLTTLVRRGSVVRPPRAPCGAEVEESGPIDRKPEFPFHGNSNISYLALAVKEPHVSRSSPCLPHYQSFPHVLPITKFHPLAGLRSLEAVCLALWGEPHRVPK
jgi:hypothetical protein